MPKRTVQDLILHKLDALENKVDKFTTEKLPELMVQVAKITVQITEDTKKDAAIEHRTTRIWGGIAAGVTLVISIISVSIAYFKH